jgi:4-amino-4-deoxy-L-arabinose transferase-like glycosyltransferase
MIDGINASRRAAMIGLLAILGLFALLGLGFSLANPVFESPDEWLHYQFIRQIVDTRRLPVQTSGELSEYHQPPLYYLLGAAAAWVVPNDGYTPAPNPFGEIDPYQAILDPKSQFLHSPAESFPYRGTFLAVHLVRWLSLLIGGCTIVVIFLLLQRLFANRLFAALGALAFIAFNPQFLFIAASINNDGLVTLWGAVAVWWSIWIIKSGITPKRALVGGLVLGAALLTKVSAGVLGIVMLAAIALTRANWRERLKLAALVVLTAGVVSGWWFLRNVQLYGELTGVNMMLNTWGVRNIAQGLPELSTQLGDIWSSYWGRFGYGQIILPDWTYAALLLLSLLALVSLVRQVVRGKMVNSIGWRELVILIISLVIWLAAVASFAVVNPTGANGRYLFPAMAAVGCLLFVGLRGLWKTPNLRLDFWVAAACLAGMLAFAAFALLAYMVPAFTRPLLAQLADVRAQTRPLGIRFGDAVLLLGYQVEHEAVMPGEWLSANLCWQALTTSSADYAVSAQLTSEEHGVAARLKASAAGPQLPGRKWQRGDVLCDTLSLQVKSQAAAPAVYDLDVGLVDRVTGKSLTPVSPAGIELSPASIAQIKLRPPVPVSKPIPNPVQFDLGGQIQLAGYDIDPKPARPGEPVTVTLFWRAVRRPEADYTVFVHILDANNRLVAQSDSQPQSGSYPTSFWDESEIVEDSRTILIPAEVPPGQYAIATGLYRLDTGERLPVNGDAQGVIELTPLPVGSGSNNVP